MASVLRDFVAQAGLELDMVTDDNLEFPIPLPPKYTHAPASPVYTMLEDEPRLDSGPASTLLAPG